MKSVFFLFLLFATQSFAQPKQIIKISSQVSENELKENLYYLASDKMEGRMFASHGDTLASEFVADWFKKNNLLPTTKNSNPYFQTIVATKRSLISSEFTVNQLPVSDQEGWINIVPDSLQHHNIPIVFVGYGNVDEEYNDLANVDVKGKAVLIVGNYGSRILNNFVLKARRNVVKLFEELGKRGAAIEIVYRYDYATWHPRWTANETFPTYDNKMLPQNRFPYFIINQKIVNKLLEQNNVTINQLEDSIHNTGRPQSFELKARCGLTSNISTEIVKGPNVLGIVQGTDPAAGHIIVCAHHDHDGKGKNGIYYGAVDNASGTVAIMEIAALLNAAAKKGYKPKRTIVIASFTGEERGLLGAQYYVDNPLLPLSETKAVYNLDMLGRVDTIHSGKLADSLNYVYTLVKDSVNFGLQRALEKANASTQFMLDNRFNDNLRFLNFSDQLPFHRIGIPVIRTMCGYPKEYHQITDTPDKINYPLLKRQTQLAFLTVWNLAND
jgi:hypothetical protein